MAGARPGARPRRREAKSMRMFGLVVLAVCVSSAVGFPISAYDGSCVAQESCTRTTDDCKPHGTQVVVGTGLTCVCRPGAVLSHSWAPGYPATCVKGAGTTGRAQAMPEREAELHDTVRRGGVVDLGGQEWVLTRPLEIEFPVTLRNGTLAVETEAWWVSDDYAIHIEAPFAIQVTRGRQARLEGVTVRGRGVFVDGAELTMRDSRVEETAFAGIYATGGAMLSVVGGSVDSAGTGVWVGDGATAVLEGLTVRDARWEGIVAIGADTRVTFRGGSVEGTGGTGLAALAGSWVEVSGADISRSSGAAGVLAVSSTVGIRGSVVRETASGAGLEGRTMSTVALEDTAIVGGQWYQDGILVSGQAHVTMTRGTIDGVFSGVTLNSHGSFTATDVDIRAWYGFYVGSGRVDATGGSLETRYEQAFCASGVGGLALDGVRLEGGQGLSFSKYADSERYCEVDVSGRTVEDVRRAGLDCGGAPIRIAGQVYESCEDWLMEPDR